MQNRFHLVCALLAALLAGPATAQEAPAPGGWGDVAVLRNGFRIPHLSREERGGLVRLYLNGSPRDYLELHSSEIAGYEREPLPPAVAPATAIATEAQSAAAPADLETLVAAASRRHGVDADLIRAVIAAESAFNARAVSPRGARGLMQLMPATAAELGLEDSFDPAGNIEAGTRYLRRLLALYGNDLARALAAYNAGPQRVAQHGGIPPYRETRAYVARVISEFNRRKHAAWAAQRGLTTAGDAGQ